jgi:hypothetical protein
MLQQLANLYATSPPESAQGTLCWSFIFCFVVMMLGITWPRLAMAQTCQNNRKHVKCEKLRRAECCAMMRDVSHTDSYLIFAHMIHMCFCHLLSIEGGKSWD